jgi:PAS domain S-box-containing protein
MISVLYVDDEPDLLELAQLFLEQSGTFQVTTSTSAQDILDSGKIHSYEVIISDYQMPGLDGIGFLKAVRERYTDLPFILFTGRGREEVVIQALNHGADFYIQKGGDPRAQFAELANKIQYAVSRKRAEKELQRKNDELNASYEQIAANEEELRQQLDELTAKQEALKDSEERFRAFTENVPDLTTIADINGKYTYVSPSIQRITGQDAGDLLGEKVAGREALFGIFSEDAEIVTKSGRAAIQSPGETVPVPAFRVRDFKGGTAFIEGSITYLPHVNGIRGLLFHGRDISDRIHAEEALLRKNDELNASYEQLTASEEELRGQYEELAWSSRMLRENEEKFRSLFEKTHDALVLFTNDGCVDCNQQALELFGFSSKEEFLGLRPADISPPFQPGGRDSEAEVAARIRTVTEKGVDNFEWTLQRKDKSTFLADVLLSAFTLDGQQVFLSSIRDISERRRMEDELRLLKISVERSSDEVFWVDFTGTILYVNDSASHITGYSREELLAMKIFELDPDFPPEVWGQSIADLRERKTQFITTRHRCKDGTIIDVEVVAVYVNKDDREYSFAFVRDITRRRVAERERQDTIAFLNALIDQNPHSMWVSDTNGFLIRMNSACSRLLRSTEQELVGKYNIFQDPVLEEQGYLPLVRSVFEEGKVVSFPLVYDSSRLCNLPLKETVSLALEVTIFPIKDAAGTFTNAVIIHNDITERKRAEQVLAESEEKYRSLVELSPVAVVLHREGKAVYASPEAVRLLGFQRDEDFIGREVFPFIHPDDQAMALEHFRIMREEGKTVPLVEERLIRADGETITVEITAKPIQYQDLPTVLVAFRDITRRKRAEQVLAESEERYRTLVNSSFDGIAIHQNGILVFVNQTAARILGETAPSVFIGKPAIDIIYPEDRAHIAERIRQSPEKPLALIHERFLRTDGSSVDVDVATTPCTWQGRPATYVTFRDISEQKRAMDALRESEEKFRTLVETSSDFIWEVDEAGKYTYISPKIRDMLGYRPEEVLGKTPFDLMPPDEAHHVAAEFLKFVQAQQPFAGLVNANLHKDGSTVFLETSGAPWFAKDGSFAGYRGVDRNITLRKQAEDSLFTSQQMLQAVLDAIPQRVFWKDRNSVYLGCNKPLSQDAGYSDPAEIVGKTDYDTAYRETAEIYRADDRKVMETGQARINYEEPQERADGSKAWLRTSKVPLYDKNGGVIGVLGTYEDITEKKRNEDALRESEEKFRTIVENASEAIAIVQDWRIVFINRRGTDILGTGAADLEGQLFMEHVWPDDRDLLRTHHSARVAGESVPDTYDFRIIGAGGRPVWVSNSTAEIAWRGKPATLSLMTDITERKFAEAALRESEETFRRVIEGAPEAIYIASESKFVYLNPAALRLFGAESGGQLIGTPFLDRIHPRFHEAIRERVNNLYDNVIATPPLEEVYLQLDGTEIAVEVTAVPFRYMGRKVALVFVWNITDRKKAEKERRESEEKYRRILENIQDAYFQTDNNGNLTMANLSAARMFGYSSPEEMIGLPATVLYDNPQQRQDMLQKLQEHGKLSDFSGTSRRKDGTAFWTSLSVRLITCADGTVIGTEGIVRDMSERKSLEQAIQEANRKLNLLNNITRHDINNQLAVLRGYAQLAEMTDADPVITDFMQKIENAADTITRQIEFTKNYQDLAINTPAWFRLDEIISLAGRREVTFSNTCRTLEIFADPMLERVFFNLFDNAIRHGERVTQIGVRCERAPDGLVIIIEDDGVGIAPEDKEKIFEKGVGKNTGYGLFLSREILAITGITIRETGYTGVGARFEITVPKDMWRTNATGPQDSS